MDENAKDIWDVLHVLVERSLWHTEYARDNAHALIQEMSSHFPVAFSQDKDTGSEEDPGEDFTASELEDSAESHAEPVDPSDHG